MTERLQELERRIEEHPLWQLPGEQRLRDTARWQEMYLLVMRRKGFLQKVERRLQSSDSALAEDEEELLSARYSRAGRRRGLYDSCAFAESLRAAVKGYDPEKGGSFLARAAASRSSSEAYSTSAARAATPWCSAPPHSFCSLWAGTFLTTAPACLANAG